MVASSAFWKSSPANWAHFHSLYPEALTVKDAANNSKHSLPDLDSFVWDDLPSAISARDQHHMNADEYMKLVLWKTQRGQSRPTLIGYAKQLTDADVISASTNAFKILEDPRASLAAITVLKGCGPATASAILGAVDHTYPYMSDELLMAAVGDRKYTPHMYLQLHKLVADKAQELAKDAKQGNSDPSIKWTAHEVERAVFAQAMLPNKLLGSASVPEKPVEDNKTPTTPRTRTRRSTGPDESAAAKTDPAASPAQPAAEDIQKDVASGADTPKRGRGRPRKVRPDGEVATPGSAGPKRGRGRPRKNPESAVSTPSESKTPRKRGRPRKSTEAEAKDTDESAATTPKRGRGRPRKSPEASATKSEVTPGGTRRGRGRPRKNPVAEEQEDGPAPAKRARR